MADATHEVRITPWAAKEGHYEAEAFGLSKDSWHLDTVRRMHVVRHVSGEGWNWSVSWETPADEGSGTCDTIEEGMAQAVACALHVYSRRSH
ncbi:hypothetical protein BB934_45210 (plasmid) [Microvirga ossetica]|uniref:Uncharacterized protein n=1 Tax=Microvirga ossetica TaxID=1882682 RepID=A0A1B2EZM4_9HYPH|nr:hypothetical protein [Microvirga ossetica]ANY85421.1 hypothetical protein BB934_45210 [Microvirga ossetica]